MWCRGQDGAHVEDVSFGPSAEPPGTCAALVGPIAILMLCSPSVSPTAKIVPIVGAFAMAKPESAMVVAAAKIRRFIPNARCDLDPDRIDQNGKILK